MSHRSRRRTALRLIGCLVAALLLAAATMAAPGRGDEWPQWRGPNRDGVWREQGLIERFPEPPPAPRWRAPIANGYSGPTVADGRVYVTDRVQDPQPRERVHCLDWATGERLWSHAYECNYAGLGYPDGPRASVTVVDGRAYALGAMGHFTCLDARSGRVLWSKDLDALYDLRVPVWGISPAPLVERDLVILHVGGSGEACLIAFDRRSGEERWKALADRPSYSAPVVVDHAGKRVLICWTGDRVVGLDPASGRLYWEYSFPARRMVIAIPTPVVDRDLVFFTSFYDGSLLLRLIPDRLAVERVWQRCGQNELNTDALHSIISTPLIQDGYIYGVDSYGELRCLDLRSGDRIWEDLTAVPKARWSTIHFVKNGDRVWMFNERGQLIIARLSPRGYQEMSRAPIITPTLGQLNQRGGVCWSHPAFAYGHVFARNDAEVVCYDLRAHPER